MKSSAVLIAKIGLLLAVLNNLGCDLLEPRFVEVPCPEITGFLPNGAPFDSVVTIKGVNFFDGDPELHRIWIGSKEVPTSYILSVPDPQTIRFRVPKGIGNGPISVALKTATDCPAVSENEFIYYYTVASAGIMAGTLNNSTCADCFNQPKGMDLNAAGDLLLVADCARHVIKQLKLLPAGVEISRLAGVLDFPFYKDDGIDGLLANFNSPSDVAVDQVGNVYVADEFNQCIRKIDNTTRHAVSTVSGINSTGTMDNCALSDARYIRPSGIEIDAQNRVYVSEFTGQRVRRLQIAENFVTTFATGNSMSSGTQLNFPAGLAFTTARSNNYSILIADKGNKKLRGVGTNQLFNIPTNDNGLLDLPTNLDVDPFGNVFVTDQGNNQLFVVYKNDEIKPLAGKGIFFFFAVPSGVVFDHRRNAVYMSDSGTHVIYKFQLE